MSFSGEGTSLYVLYPNGQWGPVAGDYLGRLDTNTVVTIGRAAIANRYPTIVNDMSIVILLTDVGRMGFSIFNSVGICYIGLGSAVSPFNYSYRLTPNSLLELDNYYGPVYAIRDMGETGVVMVTERI